ncbi:acyl-CoA thioesterase [Flavobacterium wongokense]|uniref:acyl-CoA thioesterase n=1 Tax=Flavobacterium wongokense TaxID=2910674 RepID=UPI001F228CFD|nr:acyl-CoA thioesterase [Flavobacterium sp. WG47]MCF6133156.1 acyl-CoA thioesterase [Flavobacterium sp. WG47]
MEKKPNSVYKVRFSDCDLFGHLNNARYIDYFMNAREDHLKDYYNLKLTDYYQKGISWVVTSHEIAYLRSAVYDEMVNIESSLLLAEADGLYVELIMADETKTHLKAVMRTKFTPINPKTGKKEIHTAEFMEWAKSIENTSAGNTKNLQDRIKELRYMKKEKETV